KSSNIFPATVGVPADSNNRVTHLIAGNYLLEGQQKHQFLIQKNDSEVAKSSEILPATVGFRANRLNTFAFFLLQKIVGGDANNSTNANSLVK
ncbi:MAG: hypothetical protein WAU24_05660, partial [Chitinophagaceae bacterium]